MSDSKHDTSNEDTHPKKDLPENVPAAKSFYFHQTEETRAGYVGIVGKPNVGKSTLLNVLLGYKLSITTRKPQTTRDNILAAQTIDDCQITYIDTPGLHKKMHNIQNKQMNKNAQNALFDAHLVLFVVDARYPCTQADLWIVDLIKSREGKAFLLLNKIDESMDEDLKTWVASEIVQSTFDQVIPISAKKKKNLDVLQAAMMQQMPLGPHLSDPKEKSKHDDAFILSEFIREGMMNNAHQEIPYLAQIDIEKIEKTEKITFVNAVILVPKSSYKKIIIGHKGETIKHIGMAARKLMEQWLDSKVHLVLWVKVRAKMSHHDSPPSSTY